MLGVESKHEFKLIYILYIKHNKFAASKLMFEPVTTDQEHIICHNIPMNGPTLNNETYFFIQIKTQTREQVSHICARHPCRSKPVNKCVNRSGLRQSCLMFDYNRS